MKRLVLNVFFQWCQGSFEFDFFSTEWHFQFVCWPNWREEWIAPKLIKNVKPGCFLLTNSLKYLMQNDTLSSFTPPNTFKIKQLRATNKQTLNCKNYNSYQNLKPYKRFKKVANKKNLVRFQSIHFRTDNKTVRNEQVSFT